MASATTTVKVGQETTLPALPVAEHVTLYLPRAREDPEGMVQEVLLIPALSTAVKVQDAIAVAVFPLVGVNDKGELVVKGGHVKVGGVLSKLVMENEQEENLLALSVAVHPMYTVPTSGNNTGLLTLQL